MAIDAKSQSRTIQDDIQSKLVELCTYLDTDERFSGVVEKSKLPSALIVQALAERKKMDAGHHYIRDGIREILEPDNSEFHEDAFTGISWLLAYADRNGLPDNDPLKEDIIEAYDKLRTIIHIKSNAKLGMQLYSQAMVEEKAALETEYDRTVSELSTLDAKHSELEFEHQNLIAEHDEMAKGLGELQNIDIKAEEKIKAISKEKDRCEKKALELGKQVAVLKENIVTLEKTAKDVVSLNVLKDYVATVLKDEKELGKMPEWFKTVYKALNDRMMEDINSNAAIIAKAMGEQNKQISQLETELSKRPAQGLTKKDLEDIAEKVRKGNYDFESGYHAIKTIKDVGYSEGVREKDKKNAEKMAGEYRRGKTEMLEQVMLELGKNKLGEAVTLLEKVFDNLAVRKAIISASENVAKPVYEIAGKDANTAAEPEEDEKEPLTQMQEKEKAKDAAAVQEKKPVQTASEKPATSTAPKTMGLPVIKNKLVPVKKKVVDGAVKQKRKCTPCGKIRPFDVAICPDCKSPESTVIPNPTDKS